MTLFDLTRKPRKLTAVEDQTDSPAIDEHGLLSDYVELAGSMLRKLDSLASDVPGIPVPV